MAHEIAKLLLEHADSIADRENAIQKALEMGMSLTEVHQYLDWLDNVNEGEGDAKANDRAKGQSGAVVRPISGPGRSNCTHE